jgi:PiT family inorganic phosphate transporter
MSTATPTQPINPLESGNPTGIWGPVVFVTLLTLGAGYVIYSLMADLGDAQAVPWMLLILALFAALGFEFVNGFHDTANAVATVIYTHAMPAHAAVVWSGFFNFLGVMAASGAVAWGIVSLLPVELILQVNSSAGLAMVFALLLAAIIWNLGTWWLGLPSSSSHTLIGSIVGVGLANQLLAGGEATSGVDLGKVKDIGLALLISPVFGFVAAALLYLAMRALVRTKALYEPPKGNAPPPFWIRVLLIGTCTGVSFAHGSNDGQKGMGLIMLILVGIVPTAFALNRTPDAAKLDQFRAASVQMEAVLKVYAKPGVTVSDPREAVKEAVREKTYTDVTTVALSGMVSSMLKDVENYKTLKEVPTAMVSILRNDMDLIGEALKLIDKKKQLKVTDDELKAVEAYHKAVDDATRFIPLWVKVGVAIALGLGTMVGWKRIVKTVGEKIGKTHLTYGQGAAAESVAAVTIGVADVLGLPVSTTHVLSSGVAGTMAASGSGLNKDTVRSIALAWVLTLPASVLLSGLLFWFFKSVF